MPKFSTWWNCLCQKEQKDVCWEIGDRHGKYELIKDIKPITRICRVIKWFLLQEQWLPIGYCTNTLRAAIPRKILCYKSIVVNRLRTKLFLYRIQRSLKVSVCSAGPLTLYHIKYYSYNHIKLSTDPHGRVDALILYCLAIDKLLMFFASDHTIAPLE